MSETMFAKAFMASIDKRPVKLSSDYVSDPRGYPAQSPYVLPKPTHPFPRRQRPGEATPAQPISVTLKPMKSSSETLTLPSESVQTTVLDLKNQYAQKTGLDVTKIKMLLNKRPASDLKTLKDLLPQPTPTSVEFSIMVLGGVSSPAPSTPSASSPAIEIPDPTAAVVTTKEHQPPASGPFSERADQNPEYPTDAGETAAQILKTPHFWSDLEAFLVQRLRNEKEGARLVGLFKSAAGAS